MLNIPTAAEHKVNQIKSLVSKNTTQITIDIADYIYNTFIRDSVTTQVDINKEDIIAHVENHGYTLDNFDNLNKLFTNLGYRCTESRKPIKIENVVYIHNIFTIYW